MNVTRTVARILLGLVMALGLTNGVLAVTNLLGIARPFVVTSGSMEPLIQTGALVLTVPRPTSDLSIGDVVTVYSGLTHETVTHRLVDIQIIDGEPIATLKGDNNVYADPETYRLGSTTWVPVVNIPVVGRIVRALSEPGVLIPLGIGVFALFVLGFGTRERHVGRHGQMESAHAV